MGSTSDDHSPGRTRDPDRSTSRAETLISRVNRFREWGNLILILILGSILLLGVISAATGRSVPHERLEQQLTVVTRQLEYVSCILLIPPEDRIPDAVAACQVDS